MEKAVLIHLASSPEDLIPAEESLQELRELAASAGAMVVKEIIQIRPRISPKYFIGRGKVTEVARLKKQLGAELFIFDHNLTPIQLRSLEDEINRKVVDRTQLILDIFAQRARSREGKLQVELAQLNYLLPRLLGKGQLLSRLGGGIGTRGPGETKLEIDRRRIKEKITRIRKDIKKIQKRRSQQRRSRKKGPIPIVSLVGYTNAGKSTLFNALAREKMLATDQLFTTLDPVIRRVYFKDGSYFFLSDTVGFIKELPEQLITAFHATLEEVKESDCICHLVDLTSPHYIHQMDAVEAILNKLGTADIPRIKIFNKVDLLPAKNRLLAQNRAEADSPVHISAKTGDGISQLNERLHETLFGNLKTVTLRLPKSETDLLKSFPNWSVVLKRREADEFIEVKIMADPKSLMNYLPYVKKGENHW